MIIQCGRGGEGELEARDCDIVCGYIVCVCVCVCTRARLCMCVCV